MLCKQRNILILCFLSENRCKNFIKNSRGIWDKKVIDISSWNIIFDVMIQNNWHEEYNTIRLLQVNLTEWKDLTHIA